MTTKQTKASVEIALTPAEIHCLKSELLHITHIARIQPVLDDLADQLSKIEIDLYRMSEAE